MTLQLKEYCRHRVSAEAEAEYIEGTIRVWIENLDVPEFTLRGLKARRPAYFRKAVNEMKRRGISVHKSRMVA